MSMRLRRLIPVTNCDEVQFQAQDKVSYTPEPLKIRTTKPNSGIQVHHKIQHVETGHADQRSSPLITYILAKSIDH